MRGYVVIDYLWLCLGWLCVAAAATGIVWGVVALARRRHR